MTLMAGQVPESGVGDATAQTKECLDCVDELLARAGTDKSKILRAEIYLSDVCHFAGMNAAWDAWVPAGHAPTRATVEAKLAKPEWMVEIVVTAALA
jgi:enamine deaminase RidA (YjgF/YER057c/UK114 family)